MTCSWHTELTLQVPEFTLLSTKLKRTVILWRCFLQAWAHFTAIAPSPCPALSDLCAAGEDCQVYPTSLPFTGMNPKPGWCVRQWQKIVPSNYNSFITLGYETQIHCLDSWRQTPTPHFICIPTFFLISKQYPEQQSLLTSQQCWWGERLYYNILLNSVEVSAAIYDFFHIHTRIIVNIKT